MEKDLLKKTGADRSHLISNISNKGALTLSVHNHLLSRGTWAKSIFVGKPLAHSSLLYSQFFLCVATVRMNSYASAANESDAIGPVVLKAWPMKNQLQ